MDQQSALPAFTRLIQQYPDLNMTIISDILEACDQDIDRAHAALCEMVIPPDNDVPSHELSSTPQKVSSPRHHAPLRYAFPTDQNPILGTPTNQVEQLTSPQTVTPPPLQGAWASTNIGRRLRVDDMCKKYTWIRRSVVEDLFRKNADCIELVETEILQMFPIDEPAAFAPSRTLQPRIHDVPQSSRQRLVAESLRAKAADEIRRAANSGEIVSMASPDMQIMRQELSKIRDNRGELQLLASRTRKQAHIEQAKQKDDELKRLSAAFLAKIRQSDEYRNGVVDLHGLTKEEAVQIVEWKLQDGGKKRFRLITGRGAHSHNYQPVLKPALEKHFRSKRVSFTHIEDGVLSVNFP